MPFLSCYQLMIPADNREEIGPSVLMDFEEHELPVLERT